MATRKKSSPARGASAKSAAAKKAASKKSGGVTAKASAKSAAAKKAASPKKSSSPKKAAPKRVAAKQPAAEELRLFCPECGAPLHARAAVTNETTRGLAPRVAAAIAFTPTAGAPTGAFADILEAETDSIVTLLQNDKAAGKLPRTADSIAAELGISSIRVNLLLAGLIGAPGSGIKKRPATPPTYEFV